MRIGGILALALSIALVGASPAHGQEIAPSFNEFYSLDDLGAPPGGVVPDPFGGLTLLAGTNDRLLLGGAANGPNGALYEVALVRDGEGHITGFTGEPSFFAEAAHIDGGVAYGPGDVLFLSRNPLNELGQTLPGSTKTDKLIDLSEHGIGSTPGGLAFVPLGLPGGGSLKLAGNEGGQWYDAEVVPDFEGTYDLRAVTPVQDAVLSTPQGIAYVASGSAQFEGHTVLVAEHDEARVSAYQVDGAGDPVVATRRDFVTGLAGAEGAFIDSITGDLLLSTFGTDGRILVVRGFSRPATLRVITEVVNDDGGLLSLEDFSVHVRAGDDEVGGSPQPGSSSGSLYTLAAAGVEHTVKPDDVPRYTVSLSGDCPGGRVTPKAGVELTCRVIADDQEPTARLTVVTEVQGGGWLPEDFTVHIADDGAEVGGSPQPGSGAPPEIPLFAGTYVVSQDGARGYETSIGGACAADGSVTLAEGESKRCTITNRAVPLGPGLVVESYGPARTDLDWGLTEPFLTGTRAYLEDPANFGPIGTVARSLQVSPGIRVANARTLANVDVLFTGWVLTDSYSAEEKEALREFVRAGGTVIATTDDIGHTMVDAFGVTQGDGGGSPTENTITASAHPIAAGLFGEVAAYRQYDATGHYPDLGPYAREVGRNGDGTSLAVIERGVLGQGAGAVILVADVDVFSNHGGLDFNATLIKNLFAFAAGEGPLPALTVGDASAAEGTTLTFAVRLSAPSPRAVRVHYATADDTAGAPSDYTAAAGDLELAPGQTTAEISIAVNGDGAVEADERFRLNLSTPRAARIADAQGIGTITNDDVAVNASSPPPVRAASQELPPPVAGEEVNALPVSGTVRVKVRGTNRFVELEEGQQIPVGTVVDTTKGRVTIVAAGGQRADFYDGIFRLSQTKGAKPLTTLTLVEKLSCPKAGRAVAAAKKRKRRLWGDGSGKFQTKGRHSAATVVGTKWLVEDRCTSTLTKVTRGKVSVRDFVKKRTVTVRAGKQYLARAKR